MRLVEAVVDPVLMASQLQVEHIATSSMRRTRSVGRRSAGSQSCSSVGRHQGGTVSKGVDEERLLPYVPKAYEIYVLCALPMLPFLLLLCCLGPMLLAE